MTLFVRDLQAEISEARLCDGVSFAGSLKGPVSIAGYVPRLMGISRLSSNKQLRVLAVTAGAFVLTAPQAAHAREHTATSEVLLKVTSACRVNADRLDFGFATKGMNTAVASTTIVLNCTPGVNYRVGIDNGDHYSGGTRRMYGGQAQGKVWYVDYRIYRDAARSLQWGNGAANSVLGTMPITGTVTLPVFGTADLKNVRPSEYRDMVTITLEF